MSDVSIMNFNHIFKFQKPKQDPLQIAKKGLVISFGIDFDLYGFTQIKKYI